MVATFAAPSQMAMMFEGRGREDHHRGRPDVPAQETRLKDDRSAPPTPNRHQRSIDAEPAQIEGRCAHRRARARSTPAPYAHAFPRCRTRRRGAGGAPSFDKIRTAGSGAQPPACALSNAGHASSIGNVESRSPVCTGIRAAISGIRS